MPTATENSQPDRLLRLPEVLELIPVQKSAWYAGIATGRFPEPVRFGRRCTCWRLSDIKRLIAKGTTVASES